MLPSCKTQLPRRDIPTPEEKIIERSKIYDTDRAVKCSSVLDDISEKQPASRGVEVVLVFTDDR